MSDKHKVWPRTVRGFILIAFVLGVLVALEVFSRFLLEGSVADGPREMVQISIPDKATVTQIAEVLYEHKLIDHPVLFRYAVRIIGVDSKIQAGNMALATGQSLFDLIRNLTRIHALGMPVTIPEGKTAADMASLLQQKIGIDSVAFMSVVTDTQFVHDLGLRAPSLEGYLFPDTYFIANGTDPRRVAMRMVANFRNHLPKDFGEQAEALDFDMNAVITLASIVEWETFTKSEARTIASVYLNRLKRDMPLQADPTVSYALGKGPSRLYYSDLRVDSPYNTYKYPGLPPGPINNPGQFSIEAVLHPDNTGYYYFVARGDGTHIFTTNLSDHLAAKQQVERTRKFAARSDTTG
jgi:UPF0755 protein